MKKQHSISVKVLIIIAIAIPIIIYILSGFVKQSSFKEFFDNTFIKLGLSEQTVTKNSTEKKSHSASQYQPTLGGDYVWGSYEVCYSDWSVPYTVTQEQYGYDSPLVGYCCYLGWPTVKSALAGYMFDIDEQGTKHAYPYWTNGLRLANKDGHKQRIECTNEATFGNLSKAIAYAESGLNGKYTNGDIQNLVWNSHIWVAYGADSVVEGNLGSATTIDTLGNVGYHFQGDAVTSHLVRAQQFATWAYQVLGGDDTLNIKLTPDKELEEEMDTEKKLHVEVDQATLSYLVGPYQLDLTLTEGGDVINGQYAAAGTSAQTLGDFLYKEMTMQNYAETSANTFIKTRFIIHAEYTDGVTKEEVEVKRNGDGTIAPQTDASQRVVITDENGAALPYGIPEFGKKFYIKYYLTNELAQDKTLKYLEPEIKVSYLNSVMAAGGVKAHSTRVLYSVHYSLCNEQDRAVNRYVRNKGYSKLSLGDSDGFLHEAFFYGKTSGAADINEGVAAMKEMVAASNQGGTANVIWYDDGHGWDGVEHVYATDEYDMCDGVYLDECDYCFWGYNGASYPHGNFFYACEHNSRDDWYDALIQNRKTDIWMTVDWSDSEITRRVGKVKYLNEEAYELDFDPFKAEDASSTNCGCDENGTTGCKGKCCGNDKCNPCKCYKPAQYDNYDYCGDDDECEDDCDCDDCDCGDSYLVASAVYCSCACTCKYRYEAVEIRFDPTTYYREFNEGNFLGAQGIKDIELEEEETKYSISASGYSYDSEEDAYAALLAKIQECIDDYFDKCEDEFHDWYYAHASGALYVPSATEELPTPMPFIEEEQECMQKVIYTIHLERNSGWNDSEYHLTKKEMNEYLGGNVNENKRGINSTDDAQKEEVWQGAGIEVALIDLGAAPAEPQPPIEPTPPDIIDTPIPEPVPPTRPVKPTRDSGYSPPKESPTQYGHQCAIYAAINELQVMGFDVNPDDALNWMIDKGYYGADDHGPYPSRAHCVEFIQEYIDTHENEHCTNLGVKSFYDSESGGGYYLNETYLRNHLPQNVDGQTQYEEGVTYSTFEVPYFGANPGINNSDSHYVTFSEYRVNPTTGKFEVYVLNSGRYWDSQWLEWDSISSIYWQNNGVGQGSLGDMDPTNPHDAGIIEGTYQPNFTMTEEASEWETMSEEEFQKALEDWQKAEDEYWNVLLPEYNRQKEIYDNYINNILPQSTEAWNAYYAAKAQYDTQYAQYLEDHSAWETAVSEAVTPKVVQVTVTDQNGNYGFQRLNPLHTYKIQFRYDGLEYIAFLEDPISMDETTEIADDISGRITAAELQKYTESFADDPRQVLQGREEVNDNFADIDASNINYSGNFGNNKAYGWFTKLRGSGAEFYNYTPKLEPEGGLDNNVDAMRFVDAYYEFKKAAIDERTTKGEFKQDSIQDMVTTYDDIEKTPDITYDYILSSILPGKLGNANTTLTEGNKEYKDSLDTYNEATQVCNFINDSLVVAETKIHFPDNNLSKFFLEDVGSGNTEDTNNKKYGNSDSHSNYNHQVCDDPFPVNVGTGRRRVNSLYNNDHSSDAQTINNRDQARNIDYEIQRRDEANLVIGMDLEAVTLLVNGQREVYQYGDLKLDESNVQDLAKVSARAGNTLQNYQQSYSRIITESMYLYDGKMVDATGGDVRDLSMFITYKIVIKNISKTVDMDVGYIVDHFDSYYLKWDKDDQARVRKIVNNPDYYTAVVTVNDDKGGSHPYDADKKSLAAGGISNMYNEVFIEVGTLNHGEAKTMTITFEQTKDIYGRLNINQDLESGSLLIGDKNVVEIDGYSTSSNDIFKKGLITRLSNIGNLCPVDFYDSGKKAGGLKDDKTNPIENRVEVDTASAPNLVIYIPPDGFIPCISGYTFEDVRSEKESNAHKALIGNGKYDTNDEDLKKKEDNSRDKDTKIRGVTVELVELVRQVDSNGLTASDDDTYIKEKIWGSTTFKVNPEASANDARRAANGPANNLPDAYSEDKEKHERYYSGSDEAQIIMDVSSGYLKVENRLDDKNGSYISLNPDDGMYKFVNVPPGTFVVRFIYGDTTQTVLTNDVNNDVNHLLSTKSTISTGNEHGTLNYNNPNDDEYMFMDESGADGYVSTIGLNKKSYNGNDYKSTIYQTELSQDTSYEGIYGFGYGSGGFNKDNYEKQNYTNNDGITMTKVEDYDLLNKLYYYDITEGDKKDNVSDAKDIYAFRQNSDNYAKGYISSLTGDLIQDHKTAQNEIYKIEHIATEGAGYDPADPYTPDFSSTALGNGDLLGENPITLRNYRNEIMNSFEQVGTYTVGNTNISNSNTKPANVEENENRLDANRQIKMLQELMKYTRIVAQTGIINFEVEYTNENWKDHGTDKEYIEVEEIFSSPKQPSDDYFRFEREKHYHIRDLNLGLVERPEAQIRLNKNASNVKISLSSGETLFDTSKSVNNLYFAYHKVHTYKINDMRLQSVKVTTNSLNTPELIQAYMDDELIQNATLEVKYVYTIENIGEIDYLDKQFYYTGKEENPDDLTNISRTNIDEVLDYVPNSINFNATVSNSLDELRVKNVDETKLNSGYEKSNWQVKAIVPDSISSEMSDNKDYYKNYIYPFGVTNRDAQREQTPIGQTAIDASSLSTAYLHGNNDSSITGASAGNLNADLVNREFFDRVYSYSIGSIITTDRLSTKKYNNDYYCSIQYNGGEAYTFGLLPKVYDTNKEEYYKIETPVILSVVMSQNEDLVFPNLVEAVRISNSVGRRCTYSTVGNQPMANQSYGSDVPSEEPPEDKKKLLAKYSTYSPIDVVTPVEIDADSSQNVRILPPTGFNKNNSNLYFALIGAFSIIIVAIFMIKIGFNQRKNRKKSDISRWT